jgi:hypothetical protein
VLTFALGWLLGRKDSGDENPAGTLDNQANIRQNV